MQTTQITSNSLSRYQDTQLEVDFNQRFARLDSLYMVLTRKEYELLALLVANAGEIIPREVLLMRVWGYGPAIRTRTLDVHIRRLRKKLASYNERCIETVFSIGYRFQPLRTSEFSQADWPLALTA